MNKSFYLFMKLNIIVGVILLNNNVSATSILDTSRIDALREAGDLFKVKNRILSEGLYLNLIKINEYINEQIGNEQLILAKLGKPKSQTVLPSLPGKDGLPTGIVQREFVYDGLTIYLINIDTKEESLYSLTIRKNSPDLSLPVKIGMDKNEVMDYLGSPGYEHNGTMGYYLPNENRGLTLIAIFECKNDKVIKIKFERLNKK